VRVRNPRGRKGPLRALGSGRGPRGRPEGIRREGLEVVLCGELPEEVEGVVVRIPGWRLWLGGWVIVPHSFPGGWGGGLDSFPKSEGRCVGRTAMKLREDPLEGFMRCIVRVQR